MKKSKIVLLVCSGLISIGLISCGLEMKKEAKAKELESYREKDTQHSEELEDLSEENEEGKKSKEEKIENKPVVKEDKAKEIESKKEEIKYNRYTNPRFGFSIDYPSNLTKGLDPTNMDGAEFKGDAVELVASGSINAMNRGVDELYNEELENIHGNVTHKNKGKDFYIISGIENGEIYYEYTKVGGNAINRFSIKYPESEKNTYDKVVEHIYKSFKTGELNKPI